MKALLQKVKEARVEVENQIAGRISAGILVFLGVEDGDDIKDIEYLVKKIANIKIFEDEEGGKDVSLLEKNYKVLVVSQFTLCADTKKGNKPSYTKAAKPDVAIVLYNRFIEKLKSLDISVETGVFQTYMQVYLINDGPMTFMIDSKNR